MSPSQKFYTYMTVRGKKIEYFLSVPVDYDPTKAYATMLALPPGAQTKEYVGHYASIFDYFHTQGWVVVSPAIPGDKLYFQGAERYLPGLLDEVQKKIIFEGGKYYCLA
ncbi:MAG: hypothetical protein N2D54_02765 [Chloroflexota bacterium]